MRFIENISQETICMLQRIYKQSKHHRVRQRAHCILLSFQHHTTTELVEIFQVDRITLYHWFNAWEFDASLVYMIKQNKGVLLNVLQSKKLTFASGPKHTQRISISLVP